MHMTGIHTGIYSQAVYSFLLWLPSPVISFLLVFSYSLFQTVSRHGHRFGGCNLAYLLSIPLKENQQVFVDQRSDVEERS